MELNKREIVLDLSSAHWRAAAVPVIEAQLRAQGRTSPSFYRYNVAIEITEGRQRPAKDVDNYYKPTIDAITHTKCMWNDDSQIDEVTIVRRRDKSLA
jgi:Holliday junction resolvase RusA-like endonuclease